MTVRECIEAYQTRARELRALTDDAMALRQLSLLIEGLERRANSKDVNEHDLRMYLIHARGVLLEIERRLGLSLPEGPATLPGE